MCTEAAGKAARATERASIEYMRERQRLCAEWQAIWHVDKRVFCSYVPSLCVSITHSLCEISDIIMYWLGIVAIINVPVCARLWVLSRVYRMRAPVREYNQFWESQQQHAVPRANHTIKNHVDDDDKHRIDAISLLELYVCVCVCERASL